jgi:glycosyltransferase involved in cell wall biosynthesis
MTGSATGAADAAGLGAVAITVVAYEAEAHICRLLDRIPRAVLGGEPLVLVSDDASTDRTSELAERWAAGAGGSIRVRHQHRNLGYGGNQKHLFAWAEEEGAGVVVLLHGDGQYPPEMIEDLVGPIVAGDAAAVFGSRMSTPGGARAGGMPAARFLANKSLGHLLNLATGERLTDWFSGFRAYRLSVMTAVGWDGLPDGFDFDPAVTLRLLDQGHRVAEVAIPTHYGDQRSRVPLLRTGVATIRLGAGALGRRVTRRRRPSARSSSPVG